MIVKNTYGTNRNLQRQQTLRCHWDEMTLDWGDKVLTINVISPSYTVLIC